MTLESRLSKAIFTGNGVATHFPFNFRVWAIAHLDVSIMNPEGQTVTATGWTATLTAHGGTVAYLHRGVPLPHGWKLVILRNMPFVQGVDLVTGTRFDPEVVELQLDQATAERQQLLEKVGRAIVVPPGNPDPPALLAEQIFEARDQAINSANQAATSAVDSQASAVRAQAIVDASIGTIQDATQASLELLHTEVDLATAEADRAEAAADTILTLSVSAHASPNGNVAADYSPETGMLHLYVPQGERGDVGLQGATGAQGSKGEKGDRGEKGVQGPVGSTGTAPLIDTLCCGGAKATHITIIYGGQAASFGG